MAIAHNGYLITLEGGEGGGKSTISAALESHLVAKGLTVARFREPGDTVLGDEIRSAVHATRNTVVDPRTEALLYQASRAQLVHEKVIPALENKKIVILDRFSDSSLAYQGVGRQLGKENITWLNNFSTSGLLPNLTFLLDIDPEIGIVRREESGLEMNRLDKEEIEFHNIIRAAYIELATQDPERWIVIDANKPLDEVQREIVLNCESSLVVAGFIEGNSSGPERNG